MNEVLSPSGVESEERPEQEQEQQEQLSKRNDKQSPRQSATSDLGAQSPAAAQKIPPARPAASSAGRKGIAASSSSSISALASSSLLSSVTSGSSKRSQVNHRPSPGQARNPIVQSHAIASRPPLAASSSNAFPASLSTQQSEQELQQRMRSQLSPLSQPSGSVGPAFTSARESFSTMMTLEPRLRSTPSEQRGMDPALSPPRKQTPPHHMPAKQQPRRASHGDIFGIPAPNGASASAVGAAGPRSFKRSATAAHRRARDPTIVPIAAAPGEEQVHHFQEGVEAPSDVVSASSSIAGAGGLSRARHDALPIAAAAPTASPDESALAARSAPVAPATLAAASMTEQSVLSHAVSAPQPQVDKQNLMAHSRDRPHLTIVTSSVQPSPRSPALSRQQSGRGARTPHSLTRAAELEAESVVSSPLRTNRRDFLRRLVAQNPLMVVMGDDFRAAAALSLKALKQLASAGSEDARSVVQRELERGISDAEAAQCLALIAAFEERATDKMQSLLELMQTAFVSVGKRLDVPVPQAHMHELGRAMTNNLAVVEATRAPSKDGVTPSQARLDFM